jgi:glycosyltransferase involved in cell wall biosynthesis
MMTPQISVIIPSFNHARFLSTAIESVQSQSVQDIEIIIVDDGSTDGSAEVIQQLLDSGDKRIRAVIFENNRGACTAINTGIEVSTAPLIAICNSDDAWESDKLSKQLAVLTDTPQLGAVFTDVCWVDEDAKPVRATQLPLVNIFRQRNRSRADWLRDLVEFGNCLCHPSVLIRREVYDACGIYDNYYRQVPDYDMWIRVVEKFPICVLPDQTVKFRLLRNQGNTSSPSPSNSTRSANEIARILKQFFRRVSPENFFYSFGTIKLPSDPNFSFALEKALYLLRRRHSNATLFSDIGLETLYELVHAPLSARILKNYDLPADFAHVAAGLSSPWVDRARLGGFSAVEETIADEISGGPAYFAVPKLCRAVPPVAEIIDEPFDDEEESKEDKLLRAEYEQLIASISWKSTRPLREIKALVLRKKSSGKHNVEFTIPDEWLQRQIAGIRSSTSWKLTHPFRSFGSFIGTVTNQLVPPHSAYPLVENAEIDLAIFDDAFPHAAHQPAFQQLMQYLTLVPNAVLYTSGAKFVANDIDETIYSAIDRINKTEFGYETVRLFGPSLIVKPHLSYSVDIETCLHYLSYFERNSIPFVLGTGSDDAGSDESGDKLNKLRSSPLFLGVVRNGEELLQYLQNQKNKPLPKVKVPI